MNYPIPNNSAEIVALRHQPVDEELIVAAIAGVVHLARAQGQSLEELTSEVMADHRLLDRNSRLLLSEIVAQAWNTLGQDHAPQASIKVTTSARRNSATC